MSVLRIAVRLARFWATAPHELEHQKLAAGMHQPRCLSRNPFVIARPQKRKPCCDWWFNIFCGGGPAALHETHRVGDIAESLYRFYEHADGVLDPMWEQGFQFLNAAFIVFNVFKSRVVGTKLIRKCHHVNEVLVICPARKAFLSFPASEVPAATEALEPLGFL